MSAAPKAGTSDFRITVTGFLNFAASTKTETVFTLTELAALIRRTNADHREWLPWLKLARFGDDRTKAGSLRHNGNVLRVSGTEGDYDGGLVAMTRAAEMLSSAGILAILYTSPSHTEALPRWRVLCPLSREYPPEDRDRFLNRVNGALGGILAGESWTLSQSYYYGSVADNPAHSVELLAGTPVDLLDHLDAGATGKPGRQRQPVGPPSGWQEGDVAELPAQTGPHARLKAERLLALVRDAPEGDKHNTLFRIGRMIGGYLAAFGWSDEEGVEQLMAALPPTVDDWDAARKTAVDAIAVGRQAPLGLERPEDDFEIEAEAGEPARQGADDPLGIWNAGWDEYDIPPREWLLGTVFCKGFLSSLLADGGVGKTALRVAQILSLATGRELTGERVFRRCQCLILSFEDGRDELRRRVRAAMLYHGIGQDELDGWLYLSAPKGLKLAGMKDGSPQAGRLEKELRRAITTFKLDLVCLDPFVKTHGMVENDNNAMDFVCDLLAKIAIDLNCAVDFPHHANKGLAAPGDANRGRGASSVKDAARLVGTLTRMSPKEGEMFGLSEADPRSFVRLDDAKVNIAPSAANARWFRLVGQRLGNATPQYPEGDSVQTVAPWEPPKIWDGLDEEDMDAILGAIDAGMPNGQRYSRASAALARAAWRVVQERIPDKPEAACRALITLWYEKGALEEHEYKDPVSRRIYVGLRVSPDKQPK